MNASLSSKRDLDWIVVGTVDGGGGGGSGLNAGPSFGIVLGVGLLLLLDMIAVKPRLECGIPPFEALRAVEIGGCAVLDVEGGPTSGWLVVPARKESRSEGTDGSVLLWAIGFSQKRAKSSSRGGETSLSGLG